MSNSFSLARLSHSWIVCLLGILSTLLCVCLCMGVDARSAYAETQFHQWNQSTVEWGVDGTKLIIRPLHNAEEGIMPNVNHSLPWEDSLSLITHVEFQKSIRSNENLSGLFDSMEYLESIDFGNFNTSQATDMSSMFYHCNRLENISGLSRFDTSNVANMNFMFGKCLSLQSLDLSSFDTSNVTNMSGMFYYCSILTMLDLSRFNTAQVVDMSSMFYFCKSLETIYVSNAWNTDKVENAISMYQGCNSLRGQQGTEYTSSSTAWGMDYARIDGHNGPGYLTHGFDFSEPPSLLRPLIYGNKPDLKQGTVVFGQDGTPVEGLWTLDHSAPKPQAQDTTLHLVFNPKNPAEYPGLYRTIIVIEPVQKRPVNVKAHVQTIYKGEALPLLTYTLSEPEYQDQIIGNLFIEGDPTVVGDYEIKSNLSSDNLEISYTGAHLRVEAKPAFSGGEQDVSGGNVFNNASDPNVHNTPATPTDPSVPTTSNTPGWAHINGNWYYYNLSGTLISGWISDSYHWYYLSPEGIMQVGWLLDPQDNNWYYLNNTPGDTYGALQTEWLLDVDGAWYYLNPISDGTLGSVQSGWLSVGSSWYYANPYHDTTFGALQEGWLSYNDAWYYLYPIHDGSFGYMYIGFNLIDMKSYVFTETGELV